MDVKRRPKFTPGLEVGNPFLVAPSLLSADFSILGDEIAAVTKAGADWIHVDVMDGNFVPNLTLGPPVIKSLHKLAEIPLDVHLMIDRPERYIDQFMDAGADILTLHVESSSEIEKSIARIKARGVRAGITLRPGTPLDKIQPFLPLVDLVLVMSVEPGFGGQSFLSEQTKKIDWLYDYRKQMGLSYFIEVDGGINAITAGQCLRADVLVAGNFVFKGDYRENIQALKRIARFP